MKTVVGVLLALAGAVAIFAGSRSVSAAPALEPGLWKVTLKSTTNGKADPDQEFTQCLRDELKDLVSYFAPQLEGSEAECERTRPHSEDRIMAYHMLCRGEDFTVDAQVSVTVVDPRKFTLSLRTDSRAPGETAVVVAKGEGRWTGECEPTAK